MYDIFCSYAHSDNDNGWIDDFIKKFISLYKKMTGEKISVFIDNESIITADIWSNKIINSIIKSKICLAFVSPSYVKSEWCRKEWNKFIEKESKLKTEGVISNEAGIIVPILLYNFDRGRYSTEENIILEDIKKRQWFEFVNSTVDLMVDPSKVKPLVEAVIDIVYEIEKAKEGIKHTINIDTLIVDSKTGYIWSGTLSTSELTIVEARVYVEELNKISQRKWRIPTKEEIESIIDYSLINDDAISSPYPLRQPFNAQKYGFLHTSTIINGNDKHNYIMNVRNCHIFNGFKMSAYLRLITDNSHML
jgi:hypothetical protein